MAKTHLEFVVEHFGPRNRNGGWRLMKRKTEVHRMEGETKRAFLIYARDHVRQNYLGQPRQLLIRDLKGRFCDEASYDCDSPARG